MNVNTFHDGETTRQQRNLTNSQRRNNASTKEGVLVNSFIKDCAECKTNLKDTCDTLIISQNTDLPQKLNENYITKEKSIIPISAIAVGVMGAIAGLTAFISRNTKINMRISAEKRLPFTTRNVAINEETFQAVYQMIQSPNKKTILAGVGVLALTTMAFMGKTFFDGFKDVWIKKKEADIQKNLQEQLIGIETQSFAGKIQITRSMLSDKAREFSKYLNNENKILPQFGKNRNFNGLGFKGTTNNFEDDTNKNLNYFLIGTATTVSIIGLGFLALKNLSKSKKFLNDKEIEIEKRIKDIISKTKKEPANIDKINPENPTEEFLKFNADKANLDYLFQLIGASADKIKIKLADAKWSEQEKINFATNVIKKINTSTTQADKAMGGNGVPKPSFYSHVDDYRAFFYNWLLDTDNKQFQQLFFGITGLTAFSYGGKLLGDAVKEVQVKKLNAQTEVQLQNKLVSTELRNFKSKKDAAIQPLMNEFYKQAENEKPKEELKIIADNILLEIKNGPPFVYS